MSPDSASTGSTTEIATTRKLTAREIRRAPSPEARSAAGSATPPASADCSARRAHEEIQHDAEHAHEREPAQQRGQHDAPPPSFEPGEVSPWQAFDRASSSSRFLILAHDLDEPVFEGFAVTAQRAQSDTLPHQPACDLRHDILRVSRAGGWRRRRCALRDRTRRGRAEGHRRRDPCGSRRRAGRSSPPSTARGSPAPASRRPRDRRSLPLRRAGAS